MSELLIVEGNSALGKPTRTRMCPYRRDALIKKHLDRIIFRIFLDKKMKRSGGHFKLYRRWDYGN